MKGLLCLRVLDNIYARIQGDQSVTSSRSRRSELFVAKPGQLEFLYTTIREINTKQFSNDDSTDARVSKSFGQNVTLHLRVCFVLSLER